jgi:periplasmic protein TonB
MMARLAPDLLERIKSGLIVAALHAALGYAFIAGPGFHVPNAPGDRLKLFDVPAATPPAPVEEAAPAPARAPEPEGAAAPPNLEATPAPIVAPEPEIVLPLPPPVLAAPIAGTGTAPSAGASDRPGPGTGAGGEGAGTGSGRSGHGMGGGGVAISARQISGRIVDSDYPRAAKRARLEGKVRVHFTVAPTGRATGCRIVRSSGHPELDTTTCRLIEHRFRFDPARDARGRPVQDVKGWEQVWWLEGR